MGSAEAAGRKVECLPVDRVETRVFRLGSVVERTALLCGLADMCLDDRLENPCVSVALGPMVG